MKKILVPTDFSPCAEIALAYAVEIAKRAKAEIILLHAADLLVNRFEDRRAMIEEYNQSITKDVEDQLQAAKNSIEQKEQVPVQINIYDGALTDSLQKAVEQNQIDLVVMGTHGASGLKKMIIGSNTAATIRQVTITVLTIPEGYNGHTLKQVLLAVKSAEEDLNSLAPAFQLADLFGARVRLAIFSSEGADAVDFMDDRRAIVNVQTRLQETFNKTGLKVEHLSGTNFQPTLQEFIDRNHIDLLVMITHKRGRIEGLFNRSMTREMAYHTTIPLLSLH